MPKRSSKKSTDLKKLAKAIVDQGTSEQTPAARVEDTPSPGEKDPAAVALGRLGGKKGGPARAKKLSKKRRSEIARKAAEKRWSKDKPKDSP